MKLGIVLATRWDLPRVVPIALSARLAGHEVAIFVMDAGCKALVAPSNAIDALLEEDVEIIACSNSAVGLELVEGIVRGSQDDHAAVVGTSDRLVSFT